MCHHCVEILDTPKFWVDLIVVSIHNVYVILGMNWLSSYHMSRDCLTKTITFRYPGHEEFVAMTS